MGVSLFQHNREAYDSAFFAVKWRYKQVQKFESIGMQWCFRSEHKRNQQHHYALLFYQENGY